MDLAESVLNELITLQKKNEELARIITNLEHESDVIIRQFEQKIAELQGSLKHEQDERARAGRRHEAAIRELEGAKEALIHEITEVRETYQVKIGSLEEQIFSQAEHLRIIQSDHAVLIQDKENLIQLLERESEEKDARLEDFQIVLDKEREECSARLFQVQELFESDLKKLAEEIYKKDQQNTSLNQELLDTHNKLNDLQEGTLIREEELLKTVDLLHEQAGTERKIRVRELKERDSRIRELEQTISELTLDYNTRQQAAETDRHTLLHTIDSLQHALDSSQEEHDLIVSTNKSEIEDLTAQVVVLKEMIQDCQTRSSTEIEHLTHLVEEHSNLLEGERNAHAIVIVDKENEIRLRDEEIRALSITMEDTVSTLKQEAAAASEKITHLESQVQDQISTIIDFGDECDQLRGTIQTLTEEYTVERASFQSELSDLQSNLTKSDEAYRHQVEKLSLDLDTITRERDTLGTKLQEIETFYRQEVRQLHAEIKALREEVNSRENLLTEQTNHREKQVLILSTNNESLRSELDRIRSQYNHLQETIKAEKDESVHALYRELSDLHQKIADRNEEIEALSEKVLRLDAENTRLSNPPLSPQKSAPELYEKKQAIQHQVPEQDPLRKKIVTLIADLDDPDSASDAAHALVAMGSGVVDLLISLLHSGSAQHRVWIAVILYELHDNRATIPLKKLLETPGINFREMIWEARSLYHTGNGGL